MFQKVAVTEVGEGEGCGDEVVWAKSAPARKKAKQMTAGERGIISKA